jgi:hypothetical protein
MKPVDGVEGPAWSMPFVRRPRVAAVRVCSLWAGEQARSKEGDRDGRDRDAWVPVYMAEDEIYAACTELNRQLHELEHEMHELHGRIEELICRSGRIPVETKAFEAVDRIRATVGRLDFDALEKGARRVAELKDQIAGFEREIAAQRTPRPNSGAEGIGRLRAIA